MYKRLQGSIPLYYFPWLWQVFDLLMPGIDCILVCFVCTECEVLGLQSHTLRFMLFNCNGNIAVVLLQAGTELEVEEEPEPAPYAKTLTLDRPW